MSSTNKDLQLEVEFLRGEVLRLDKLQYRQSPCYKFCESNAYEIEIRKLKADIAVLNRSLSAMNVFAKEPKAYLVKTELQDGTIGTHALLGKYKDIRDSCDVGEPIPLYSIE